MTENEAIIRFDFIRCALLGGTKPHIMPNEENIGLVDAAIKALKEVQQYQALEKRLSDMFGGSLSLKMCVDELERILTEPDSPHPMNAKILTYQEAADWEAYRKIGTVEELIRGKRYMNIAKHHGTIGQVIDECVAYEAIGTPEECRKSVDICKAMAERRISLENMENYMKFEDECVKRGFTFNSLLEAREKQTAKRALHQGCYDKNGEWHEWNGINGKPYELCPSCRVNLCCEMPLDIKPKYCKNCGQKLDWGNEE